ncbi:DUF6894 family protein [Methylobacterium planeticum]|uniref:DUF6894 domain-containing protein n=1 Tax=Methylobacterium planeticum TaxID=2615211 RepID=A0A6N6MX39_9HYPH|nr:hypothetical protein [Methylobacterium planeticum]KAB1074604.1 hypothetical protein F6X51_05580 [Methylobacterium planeticum]
MPLYFIDLSCRGHLYCDDAGRRFASLAQARREALSSLGEIASGLLAKADRQDFAVSIRDESNREVYAAKLCLAGAFTTARTAREAA